MTPLLTSDWHLTDDPDNEYRWLIFEHVFQAIVQYSVEAVFILGDIVDRKDRHSGALVNRLTEGLRMLAGRAPVAILRGNHDTPLRGPAFWEFISNFTNIHYVTKPTPYYLFNEKRADLLLLPFTPAPKQDWYGIKFTDYQALFMHATVSGAVVENGMVMQNSKFPVLPRSVRVYSGDVHTPQQVRNITYVGAPHPIKFGDRYQTRMLLLDDGFDIKLEIPLPGMHKHILDITSVEELQSITLQQGDQVKIRLKAPGGIDNWGEVEASISQWAAKYGVIVAGTEVAVESVYAAQAADPEQSPEQILRAYAAQEGMSKELLGVGLSLLKEVQ